MQKCEGMLTQNNDEQVVDVTRYDDGHAYWVASHYTLSL